MIKNETIFELRIDDEDELSGIDSISLVDDPAIEVNWVAFKKEKQQDFHIPDGEDNKYIEKLMAIAQDEQELFDEGWVVDKVTIVGENEFISTNPNGPSIEDEKEYNVRYKYILNPRITGQSAVINTTRDFCKSLIAKNYVWRVEDMDKTQNDFGDSAMVWRGGFNCRHVWSRIEYKKDATIVNKASVNKGKVTIGGFPTDMVPDTRVLGYDEPSTVTSKTLANPSPSTVRNLGLSKEKMEEDCPIATQDVETNLKNRQRAIDEAHYGPLNPNEPNEEYWQKKAEMFGGDIESAKKALCGNCAFFVKTPSMLQCIADGINDINELDTIQVANIGYCEAFDFKCAGARTCDAWVVGGPIVDEDMGYDVGTIGGYVDPGVTGNTIPKSITKPSMFESYSDYPDSVKNNAKAVLKYAEENGWGSCGTEVGKQRANQLAKGEPISEDTIRRMYSYLSRHAVDLDSSKGYGDGCGKLMYDAWGGKSALSWSEAKIKTIEKEKMSKQRFATDDEKRIVIGPAMIPDLKIFRKDSKGNPYYVYFSSDTIKMIAEKYMRNKYIDNNDENHNGKAVSDVYVVESWIKEDVQDKSSKYGYSDLPVGTWFVSMKVRNDEVWKKVKEGYLNGFSVSGYFEEVASFCMEEMFLKQVVKILNNVND
jgi:effector-binding domain-containing protein